MVSSRVSPDFSEPSRKILNRNEDGHDRGGKTFRPAGAVPINMKTSPKYLGFLQALGVALYIAAFAFLAVQAQTWAHRNIVSPHPIVAITLFLLAFVTSALVSGSVIFAYPVMLFFDGRKIEAVKIVFWSAVWLAALLLIAAAGAFGFFLFP